MIEKNEEKTPQCGCSAKPVLATISPCCGSATKPETELRGAVAPWIIDSINTPVGNISRVSTALHFEDRLGSWKARWDINRMNYRIEPGLYAVGNPNSQSPVLVSANYKMSFDRLRSQLGGRDFWILVLETYGINVWCAAGKGTFGTEEIIRRIQAARLHEVVSHRELILPQLGAPGVNQREVKERSDFRVIYGPVRARDLLTFLDAGKKATPEMRRVSFSFRDRIVLFPIELVNELKLALAIAAGLLVLSGFYRWGFSVDRVLVLGIWNAFLFLGLFLSSVILVPALLPWLPGRSFSAKGAWLGLALVLGSTAVAWTHPGLFNNFASLASWFLIAPTVASFLAMNFTGASTYTSLSGVRKEMRIAVPLQIVGAIIGIGVWLTGRFL